MREADCAVRGRISEIAAGFRHNVRDQWWTIETEDDAVTIGDELVTAISDSVLPFLDGVSTIANVQMFLSNLPGWHSSYPPIRIYLAIAMAKLGNREGADEILRSVIEAHPDSWAKNAIRAQRLLSDFG